MPTLELNIGGTGRAAAYTGTSADGKTLTFSYTVVSEDFDDDGISIDAGSIELNGSTIVQEGTSDAVNLRYPAWLPEYATHRVNGPPTIERRSIWVVSSPVAAPDTFGAGETIRVTVRFDVPVVVTGTPQLLFRMGVFGDDRQEYLGYVRGSGTRTLVFEYVVKPTDMDSDGIYIDFSPVETNGGTIRHPVTGRDADLTTHSRPGWNGLFGSHKVDGSLMPSIAALTGLALSDFTLSPNFSPGTTLYTATTESAVVETTVTATPETGADATILPADSDTDTAGHQVALDPGNNEITVTVTKTGSAPRIYTVVAEAIAEVPHIERFAIASSPASSSSYYTGETVTVEAQYTDAVTVDTSGGVPTLELNIGGTGRAAAYTGTSADGETLTFSYTVVNEDFDDDGISIDAGSIELNGSTIVEEGTSDAVYLSHPAVGSRQRAPGE